jgi:RNA polymerase sigma-70 factor (ECF subfamily)
VITVANLDDSQLLRRFVETGCQEAFNQLVNSHTNMVYSVCLRETNDPVLAQDVTQAVFLTLFHKAATIRRGTVLSGWLFNTARFAARNAMRQGNRRKAVEQELIEVMVSQSDEHIETWQTIEPLLHEAIASLGSKGARSHSSALF